MFLPFETTLSLWFSPSPVYGWEPVPPVEAVNDPTGAALPDAAAGAVSDGAGACTPAGLPAMRLVFKGVKWTAYPVFGMRANPQYDAVSQTRREEDEQHLSDILREARKAPKLPPGPKTDW